MGVHKLYINPNPTIDSYWFYADLLSIITQVDIDSSWEMNRFVNLVSVPRGTDFLSFYHGPFRNYMMNFFECPFIDFQRINKDRNKNIFGMGIIDCIKQAINEGYYSLIMIDRNFIKEYDINKFSPHQLLIYGYDEEEKILTYCDNDKTGKYRTDLTCSYSSFENAYYNLKTTGSYEFDECIYLFKPKKDPTYKFDKNYVRKELNHYLLSTPRFDPECHSPTSGIGVYTDVKNYIADLEHSSTRKDIRSLHVLYDHKKSMYKRIQYILSLSQTEVNNTLLERYIEVENGALLCRNLVLKFFFTNEPSLLLKAINYMDKIETVEQEVLEEILA